jgi:SAM-dependent methyltransferase
MIKEVEACPLCGGSAFTQVYPGSITDTEAEAEAFFTSSRRCVGYWPIMRCRDCGLVFANPHDDEATLARVYAHSADTAYCAEDENRQRMAQAYLAFIRNAEMSPGVLVDVGSATGVFACEAQAVGWRVTGVEPSAWSLMQAQTRCLAVNASLEEVDFPSASVDAVTLWDVLEHVPQPMAALLHIRAWLKPGGWLFINVPDIESGISRLLGPHWMLLLREHLWYFSPRTLSLALQTAGFTWEYSHANWVHFSLSNVAERLGQYPGALGAGARKLAKVSWLRRFSVAFPIGDMTVAARTEVSS